MIGLFEEVSATIKSDHENCTTRFASLNEIRGNTGYSTATLNYTEDINDSSGEMCHVVRQKKDLLINARSRFDSGGEILVSLNGTEAATAAAPSDPELIPFS